MTATLLLLAFLGRLLLFADWSRGTSLDAGRNGGGLCWRATRQGITRSMVRQRCIFFWPPAHPGGRGALLLLHYWTPELCLDKRNRSLQAQRSASAFSQAARRLDRYTSAGVWYSSDWCGRSSL